MSTPSPAVTNADQDTGTQYREEHLNLPNPNLHRQQQHHHNNHLPDQHEYHHPVPSPSEAYASHVLSCIHHGDLPSLEHTLVVHGFHNFTTPAGLQPAHYAAHCQVSYLPASACLHACLPACRAILYSITTLNNTHHTGI